MPGLTRKTYLVLVDTTRYHVPRSFTEDACSCSARPHHVVPSTFPALHMTGCSGTPRTRTLRRADVDLINQLLNIF